MFSLSEKSSLHFNGIKYQNQIEASSLKSRSEKKHQPAQH